MVINEDWFNDDAEPCRACGHSYIYHTTAGAATKDTRCHIYLDPGNSTAVCPCEEFKPAFAEGDSG